MRVTPIAHWQVHAERGALSHLLSRAYEHDPRSVPRPHDLSSLHIPVGGERFRPCLEDVLQFLITNCGIDSVPGWDAPVLSGRDRNFVGGSGPGGGVAEVEAAGGVEGVFGEACEVTGG
jgi:hypothetical protein